MTLDYEQLVKEYCERLFSTLRNFTPGPPFLDTWVHDDNDERSIYGIFEAAEMAKLNRLSLSVSSSVRKNLNLPELSGQLSSLGDLEITELEGKTQITLGFKHGH